MRSGKANKPNDSGCCTRCVAKVGQRRQEGYGIPKTSCDPVSSFRVPGTPLIPGPRALDTPAPSW